MGAPSTTGTNASGSWGINVTGSSASCTGNAATATTASATTAALTMNNGGAGAASGTTFNGSTAQTISYNTVGAPSTTGTNASGSWGINVTGSSASCTGNSATATNATNATNATALATTDDTTTNSTYYPGFSTSSSNTNNSFKTSSTKLTFNPSTGTLAATVLNATSDRKLKTNITPIRDAVGIIQHLNGVQFNWKDNGLPSAGLIAQDVQAVMPELVTETDDKLSLNYNGIIGALVEAIKVLTQRIEDLEAD